MNSLSSNLKEYSLAIVRLLKGTINSDDKVWDDVLLYRKPIQEYVNVIGLELIIKENDGYAFLKQFPIDDDDNTIGLVSRKQLGFETSVLLVVLRQILEDFETNPLDFTGSEKFIDNEELINQIELFLPEKYDKVGYLKKLEDYIKRIEKLGYIKRVDSDDPNTRYRIHKIIKEKVNIDALEEFKNKLNEYVESI
ncbi:DUF4194 domain-containing protein [Flagellimonas marinaquae]|jgi:hypothetical protein|uniref:DUF4194 domain-containing protein n=1 Tax=Yeosuana marina TaxID=1565536 RepID=UPI000B6D01A7|nr:MAG: DUF4194 domain-containing protein [Muricauda sp. TMED12]UBZ13306.1 DUF4194 domain-containing protein [Allomuricauda aquimarina]|tara:strand:- start:10 stop:594 length:585 start_codon:yes stop_codon:yes gene_type:complete